MSHANTKPSVFLKSFTIIISPDCFPGYTVNKPFQANIQAAIDYDYQVQDVQVSMNAETLPFISNLKILYNDAKAAACKVAADMKAKSGKLGLMQVESKRPIDKIFQ